MECIIKRKYFYSKTKNINKKKNEIKILLDVEKDENLYKIFSRLKVKKRFTLDIFDHYKKLLESDFFYFQNMQPGKKDSERKYCFSTLVNHISEIEKITQKKYLANLEKKYLPVSFDLEKSCEDFKTYFFSLNLENNSIDFLLKKKNVHKGK